MVKGSPHRVVAFAFEMVLQFPFHLHTDRGIVLQTHGSRWHRFLNLKQFFDLLQVWGNTPTGELGIGSG